MGLSTTYTKTETDFLIQQLEKKTASGYKGDLRKSDEAPTQIGFYGLLETGVYPNLGGIDAQAGKLNFASFDGTTWSKVEVAFPQASTAKLPLYSEIKSANIVAGTQFIDDENGNIIYRVKTGQTLLTTELPKNVIGAKLEKVSDFKSLTGIYPLFTDLMKDVSLTSGFYLDANNTPTAYPNAAYTDYIPVIGGKKYVHNGYQYKSKGIWYDQTQTPIAPISGTDFFGEKVYTAPINAAFVRLNVRNGDSGMYLVDNEYSKYINKYNFEWLRIDPNNPISPTDLGAMPVDDEINLLKGVTLYKSGYFINHLGDEGANGAIGITNDIPIIGGKTYHRIGKSYAVDGAYYNANGTFISIIKGKDTTGDYQFTAPGNAVKMRLNVPTNENWPVIVAKEERHNLGKYKLSWLSTPFEESSSVTIPKTYIGTRDINTYVGATNTVIDALLSAKPLAKFIFITHFTEDGWLGNRSLKDLISTQIKVAEYWGVPIVNLAKKARATKKDSLSNTLVIFADDELHPGNRPDNWSVNEIAQIIVGDIKWMYDDWSNKIVAWYGTSIPAGVNQNTAASQYPKIVASKLGCTVNNYSVSGARMRRGLTNGTLIGTSFLDTTQTQNYQSKMLDLIGTPNEPDLFVFDFGINDFNLDNTDFLNVDY